MCRVSKFPEITEEDCFLANSENPKDVKVMHFNITTLLLDHVDMINSFHSRLVQE